MARLSTHSNEERFFRFPVHGVLGVLDTPEAVEHAVQALAQAGVDSSAIEIIAGDTGVRRIDRNGKYHGPLARMRRMLQHLGEEQRHLQRYEDEITAGHYLISVPVRGPEAKHQVRDILRAQNGHFVHYYARGSIEDL